jgi:hypothetical protein
VGPRVNLDATEYIKSLAPADNRAQVFQPQWFMQDEARPHTANVVLDFPHDTFDSRIISNRFSDRFACGQNCPPPPSSPDLNPCDYFPLGIP